MSRMSREEAIVKIRKCLALSKSANEHEAGNALRFAQKLMQEFQIDPDLLDIVEATSASKATKTPSQWETWLVKIISSSMQCKPIFRPASRYFKDVKAQWTFIGVDPAPEIASYAFDVLYRQANKARKDFIDTSLKRVTVRKNKIRRADCFSDAWVETVQSLISKTTLDIPGNTKERIEKYLQKSRGELGTFTPKDRNEGKKVNASDYNAGRQAGKSAQLNNPVSGGKAPTLIGG